MCEEENRQGGKFDDAVIAEAVRAIRAFEVSDSYQYETLALHLFRLALENDPRSLVSQRLVSHQDLTASECAGMAPAHLTVSELSSGDSREFPIS